MKKRFLAGAAAAGLGLVGLPLVFGLSAASADHYPDAEECGGEYPVSVSAGYVHDPTSASRYSYCSDGTLGDLGVPPTDDNDSNCGGNYPVTVEGDTGQGVTYCSDGTIGGIEDVLAELPVTVSEDASECPNHTVNHPIGSTPLGYWTPAGASCVMSLDGATEVSGSIVAYVGAVDENGDLTASVDLTIVDNATGDVVASCSETDSTPVDGFVPGLTQVASCRVSVDADVDSVTVTASGLGAGTFDGSLS